MAEPKTYRPVVSEYRQKLHRIFADTLSEYVVEEWDMKHRPFFVKLAKPIPFTLEVYMYPALNPPGGRGAHEYKINLLLQGHKQKEPMNFPTNDNYPILVAYEEKLEVFILLDAFAHKDFTPNVNIQFKDDVILAAIEYGIASMTKNSGEVVIAATSAHLIEAITMRMLDKKPEHEVS